MDLKDIFKRYIGAEIKDPARSSGDNDPIANRISQTARIFGLTLVFNPPGSTHDSKPQHVLVHIEKIDGTPR